MIRKENLGNYRHPPWDLSYQKAFEAEPSWVKHGMPALNEEFISLVRNGGIEKGIHLDIGCGNGVKAVRWAGVGFNVVGIDISEDGFHDGLKLIKGLETQGRFFFVGASALKIPFQDASARSASDVLCFTHLFPSDYEQYLNEVSRVLKDRGHVLMVLFSDKDRHFHGHKVSGQYTFHFDPSIPEMAGYEHYDGMFNRHFNEQSIQAIFQGKGNFNILDLTEVPHPVYDYRKLWNVILRKD